MSFVTIAVPFTQSPSWSVVPMMLLAQLSAQLVVKYVVELPNWTLQLVAVTAPVSTHEPFIDAMQNRQSAGSNQMQLWFARLYLQLRVRHF